MSQEAAPRNTDLSGGETAAIWDEIDQPTLRELYGEAVAGRSMGEAFHEWQRPPFNQLLDVGLGVVQGTSSKLSREAERLDTEYTSLKMYLQAAGKAEGETPRYQAERALTWTAATTDPRGPKLFKRERPLLYTQLDDGGVGVIYKETEIALPIPRILPFYGAIEQPTDSGAGSRYQASDTAARVFRTTDATAIAVIERYIDSPTAYPATTRFGFRRLASQ